MRNTNNKGLHLNTECWSDRLKVSTLTLVTQAVVAMAQLNSHS